MGNPGVPKASALKPTVRAAQYVRMSTDLQTYSIANQKDAIAAYADIMGYEIIATYEDAGKSGLRIGGRVGLQRLLADIESRRADFETVIVYDVSRWGRFQNIDESASYEYRCQIAGVRIEYCAEQFVNDGSIGSDVLKAIKRSMAAEQSRMLSQKVFIGQCRLVRMGFWQGGIPGLGLRRLLLDKAGQPKAILARYEYKSLQTDRVILVPGPPEEIAIVRSIFTQFVKARKTQLEIARLFNKRGILTDLSKAWTRESVHHVITCEKYIGHNVWGRGSCKLSRTRIGNPPSQWARKDDAFEAIVDKKLFNRAQVLVKSQSVLMSKEQMLKALSKLLERRGKLTRAIIDAAPECPPADRYNKRFGGLLGTYRMIGYEPRRDVTFFDANKRLRAMRRSMIDSLVAAIDNAGGHAVHDNGDLVIINGEVTVAMAIARCHATTYGYPRWITGAERNPAPDISVFMRMNPDNETVRDYLIAPTSEIKYLVRGMAANNGTKLDAFLFTSLGPLIALGERAAVGELR
ncbi:recombinase family protein [Mesorhizobium sp. Cs1299R1N3]|uniref:recombinase family protein n=1 Tax=Mesorhizobium sp. Cs1299R1N3 TaxID=3015173 RepID=UPI00301D01BC